MMKGIIVEAFGEATPAVMRLTGDLPIPEPSETQVRRYCLCPIHKTAKCKEARMEITLFDSNWTGFGEAVQFWRQSC